MTWRCCCLLTRKLCASHSFRRVGARGSQQDELRDGTLLRDIRDDLRQIGYGHVEIPAVEVLNYSNFLGKYGTPAFAKKQTEEHTSTSEQQCKVSYMQRRKKELRKGRQQNKLMEDWDK